MKISSQARDGIEIQASVYRFEVAGERASMVFSSGHEFRLNIASTICRDEERDLHLGMGLPAVAEDPEGLTISIEGSSSLWPAKSYCFLLREDRIEYFIRVKGKGISIAF
jgi:hypothetical protein